MKSLSQPTAKILTLASLVIAAASYWYGSKQVHTVSTAKTAISFAQTDQAKARSTLDAMSKILPGHESVDPLNKTVETTVNALQQAKLAARVTIASIGATSTFNQGAGATKSMTPVSVGGTKLQSVTLTVRGTYADYEGLVSYLQAIRAMPVAMTRLKVDGNNVEFALMIFGSAG
jgi:hypothetical protein